MSEILPLFQEVTDNFNWEASTDSSESDSGEPIEIDSSDTAASESSRSKDDTDDDDDEGREEQHYKTFKKLGRAHRDRDLYRQIHTLEPITAHLTAEDIIDGARKYLALNTVFLLEPTTGVEIEISQELSNLRRFEGIQKTLLLRTPTAENTPNRARCLDYIFAQPCVEGRSLAYTITQTDPIHFPELTDLEIAQLVSKSPAERVRLAPQAWSKLRLYPEYRHIAFLVNEKGQPVMTPKQITQFVKHHRQKTLSEADRQEMQKIRAERAMQVNWIVTVKDTASRERRSQCPLCHILTKNGKKHMESKHPDVQKHFVFRSDAFTNPLQLPDTGAKFILPFRHYPERQLVERMAKGIINFLLRWNMPFNLSYFNYKSLVLAVVAQRIGATILHTMPKIQIKEGRKELESSRYTITLMDPKTSKPYPQVIAVDPSLMRNLNPPAVPPSIAFTDPWDKYLRYSEHYVDDTAASPQMRAVIALQKLISYHMEWKEINKTEAAKLVDFYRRQYGYSACPTEGDIGAIISEAPMPLSIVQINKNSPLGVSFLSPAKLLAARLNKPPNTVVINSVKGSEIAIAVNTALTRWMLDGDVISTWRMLCIASDTLNTDLETGHPLESVCHCNDNDAEFSVHPCDRCIMLTRCISLKTYNATNTTLRICPSCYNRYEVSKSIGRADLRKRLRGLIRHETRSLNVSTIEKVNQFEQTWADLTRSIISDKDIRDGYTNRAIDPTHHPFDLNHRAFHLSIEAVFPYGRFSNNSVQALRVHCPGNITFTMLCFNLGKHISLPGILHLVAYCWSHLNPSSTSNCGAAIIQAHVMAHADDMHLLQLKVPYGVSSRLQIPYDEGEYSKNREDWARAAPRDEDRGLLLKKRSYVHHKCHEPPKWVGRPPEHERIMGVVLEIEDKAGRKVVRGADGCPYPFYGEAPNDWTWWMCWCLFSERAARMWDWCNGMWDQVDCAETLFLVAIQNQLGLLGPEPFRLPLAIFIKHPLRFAVAHKTHGQRLRSGWTTDKPSHLSEFDPSLHNMEFQTVFSNFFFSNIANESYAKIQEEILNIRIPDYWYKPTELLRIHDQQIEKDPSFPQDDLDLSLISLNLGTYEKASLHRYTSMLLEHSANSEWIQKDEIWDHFITLEDNHRKSFRERETFASRPNVEAGIVTENPGGLINTNVTFPIPKRTTNKFRGLENANLLCWLNSTIRLLKQIEPLQQKIISFNTIELIDPYGEDTELICFQAKIVALIAQAMKDLDIESNKPLRLTELANACARVEKFQWYENQAFRRRRGETIDETQKFAPKWRPGQNQDPEEFIQWLLPILIEVGVIGDEELNSLLNVKTVEEVRCATCSKEQASTRWMDKSTDIALKLVFPNWTATSEKLTTLFTHTFRGEGDIEYAAACPQNIVGHNTLYRKTWIGRLAEYVIIHLVRTGANEEGVQIRLPAAIQDRPEVDFSAIGKPGQDFAKRYELVAEIQHIGDYSTPYNGHYMAYSKVVDEWIKFNDDYVTLEEPWEARPGELSYLLLYKCNEWQDSTILATSENTVLPLDDEVTYISDTSDKSILQEPTEIGHKTVLPVLSEDPQIRDETDLLESEYSSKSKDALDEKDNSATKEPGGKDSNPPKPAARRGDLNNTLLLDPLKDRYATIIKRYFARFVELNGICSHTDLLINTFDGCRRKDGSPNDRDETMALLKIWREALSTVADVAEVSHRINMWKLRSWHPSSTEVLSESDQKTWEISSAESESEAEIDPKNVPTRIWGTSFQLGVMCFRVSWGHIDGETWEPVKGFWERFEHVPEFRDMVEKLAKTWNLNSVV